MAASDLEVTPCTSLNCPLSSIGLTFAHTVRFSLRARLRKMNRSIAIANPTAMIRMLG